VETVDLLERLGIIELNLAKAYQPVGMLFDEILDAVEVFRVDQQKRETVNGIELCYQLFEKSRIAVVMHVRVDQLGLSEGREGYQEQ
jgi:hypothetical protein